MADAALPQVPRPVSQGTASSNAPVDFGISAPRAVRAPIESGDSRINSAYALQAQRTAAQRQGAAQQTANARPEAPLNLPQSSRPQNAPAENSSEAESPSSNLQSAGRESARQLGATDPAYANRAEMKQKQDDSLTEAAAQAADIGIGLASKMTDKYWSGLWATIPGLITGVEIVGFAGATLISWLSLARTLFSGLFDKVLGKFSAFLPPKMGPTLDGLSMFGFFIVANFIVWPLIFLLLIAVVLIAVLPYVLPFLAAGIAMEYLLK